jgi:head-tail adaptor
MRGGKLDRRITIQVSIPVDDGSGYGTTSPGWATFSGAARIAAEIQDVLPSKSEGVADEIRIGIIPARVRIRYLSGITSAMRILIHDGAIDRVARITAGPAEMGRRRGIEFMIAEFSTQGDGA